jgi:hypothetical protein
MNMHLRRYQDQSDDAHVAAFDQLMGAGILNYCTPATDIVFAEADGAVLGYGRIWLSARDEDACIDGPQRRMPRAAGGVRCAAGRDTGARQRCLGMV